MQKNKLFDEIAALKTEQNNPDSVNIDNLSTSEILQIINDEDKKVAFAVEKEIPHITEAVEIITYAFKSGGRLFYAGAGTSGRLGIVDAAECPPTFGSEPDMVQGMIAGGIEAVFVAQEGAEDLQENGRNDVIKFGVNSKDVVCGIAASGRTPYVIGAVNYAAGIGCKTIFLTTSTHEHINSQGINANVIIAPEVGPEVIEGSTRMKSGTAQKLVLNMLTTASMVKLGKTLGNVMIDLQMTNSKLIERSKRILMRITGVDYHKAAEYLEKSGFRVKTAIVMIMADLDSDEADNLIKKGNGFVRKALKIVNIDL
jgi:N-acetylmuramic acid 6-phosphate etherase